MLIFVNILILIQGNHQINLLITNHKISYVKKKETIKKLQQKELVHNQLFNKKIKIIILMYMGHVILRMSIMRILNIQKSGKSLRRKLILRKINKEVLFFTVTNLRRLGRSLESKICLQDVEVIKEKKDSTISRPNARARNRSV